MKKKTCVIKPKIEITIEGCYENEFAVTDIPERLEDLAERLYEAKEKLRKFKQYLPDKMNGCVYDQWDDILNSIDDYLLEIECAIYDIEDIEDEERNS